MDSENSLPQNNSEHSQATSNVEEMARTIEALSLASPLAMDESPSPPKDGDPSNSPPIPPRNEDLNNAPSSSVSSNTTITSDPQKKTRAELTDKEKKNGEEMMRQALEFVLSLSWNADPAEAPPLPEWDPDLDWVPPSHASSNTVITSDSEEEQKVELTEEKEKLQVKFPFAFISQENIPNISVIVQNENSITFTLNSNAISASESDPAQPLPSVILENLDSTISRQDLALLPTKILPPLLGWESIPCETLKLHNLHMDRKLLKTIQACNVKRLHLFNCTVARQIHLFLENMDTLEELEVSLPDFDGAIHIPPSLETLKVHCPKSTVDFSNELIKYLPLVVIGGDSMLLRHV